MKAPRNPDDVAEPRRADRRGRGADRRGPRPGRGSDGAGRVDARPRRCHADPGARAEEAAGASRTARSSACRASAAVRIYVGVGVNTKGKRGRISKRAAVPLVPPPAPPASPTITYDETAITVAWAAAAARPRQAPPSAGNEPEVAVSIPARSGRCARRSRTTCTSDHRRGDAADADAGRRAAVRRYPDEWGATRCYGVRAVETVDGLSSRAKRASRGASRWWTRFRRPRRRSCRPSSTEGVINLIWDANAESDLAGYVILRARAPGDNSSRSCTGAGPRDDVQRHGPVRHPLRVRGAGGRQGRQSQPSARTASRRRRG